MKHTIKNNDNDDIFATLDNCWLALCKRMREKPTIETQRVMNALARIIQTAKSETIKRKNEVNKQVSIDEWLAWLEKET